MIDSYRAWWAANKANFPSGMNRAERRKAVRTAYRGRERPQRQPEPEPETKVVFDEAIDLAAYVTQEKKKSRLARLGKK
jgi:hypothetical protein